MLNKTKEEEIVYLKERVEEISKDSQRLMSLIGDDSHGIRDMKKYMHEHVYEMDPTEVRANRQALDSMLDAAYNLLNRKKKNDKLMNSPYFGRINFEFDDKEMAGKIAKGSVVSDGGIFNVYIGIHSFLRGSQNIIYDWRSPIAGMFYDFETGRAYYFAPKGKITGDMSLKRQYKIAGGNLDYMFESNIAIDDEILQEQLSKTTNDKMKNIVATIQKEQNSVIRDEKSDVLIIQGVAGSGKTSIALHRVAYLLYRLKDKIYSENMMIISPNKVFSDYISNVLPELGEDQILQMTFEDITDHELENICQYQTMYEQVSCLLTDYDEFLINRIKFKSTNEFMRKLSEYARYVTENNFTPETFTYNHEDKLFEISAHYLKDRYEAYVRFPMMKRIDTMIEDIIDRMIDFYNIRRSKIRIAQIRNRLFSMMKQNDLLKLYADFYSYIGAKNYYIGFTGKKLQYDDVAPLLYMKSMLWGVDSFLYIKHLLIDEMQDYSPVHYAFFNNLFKCKKTILGDVSQLVNPFNQESSQADIAAVYNAQPKTKVTTMELCKSYRSTTEITAFARKIIPNDKIEIIERHGDEPDFIECKNIEDEIDKIIETVNERFAFGYKSIGIILKNEKQAEDTYKKIKSRNAAGLEDLQHITPFSTEFSNKLIITSAYLAKGLEFDSVLIAGCDSDNFKNDIDRQMVYIGATRALHKLTLFYCGEKTKLV